ncbi:TetR/AcrR family transcriptional regulator C-terminal domain-containing protein [Actinoplanes sichuanensis]|uniref:TetR/AcrR family transcriptional regulator C-terminal domain-containing protein n=1 Tax=Actinoplanes sichuanensis TaxID=512349 RepID=A0ABW4AT15_9ACTN|nr:TetR/AcrR family transcriptional regulator C-terminal domain-containing protein [Actinoplanes sichuanensis]
MIAAAVQLADEDGLATPAMRKIATALGVEAMSLYNHVSNKDDILDGMVDLVFTELELPVPGESWQDATRRHAASLRAALTRHPWATGVLQSRPAPGPGNRRHNDAVLGVFRRAGFPLVLTAHAVSVIDSYVYGFALQSTNMPIATPEEVAEVADGILRDLDAEQYPHLTEMIVDHALQPGYAYGDEFDYGLDLIINGLERALTADRDPGGG